MTTTVADGRRRRSLQEQGPAHENGRTGAGARSLVRAAAAVSAPLSLRTGGEAIQRGFNMVYTWNFLRTMRRKAFEKARRFPNLVDVRP